METDTSQKNDKYPLKVRFVQLVKGLVPHLRPSKRILEIESTRLYGPLSVGRMISEESKKAAEFCLR